MKKKFTRHQDSPLLLTIIVLSVLIIGALSVLAYMRNGIYLNHVTLWADITKRSPEKRRAHENYGQALSTAGHYKEALREFETVQSLKDDGSVPARDLYREIGVVYYRLERYDDAITAWQQGLKDSPHDPSLLNNLSVVMLQKKRYDEAAGYAQSALSAAPYMPQALNTMGQVYLAKTNYAKAAEYFLMALEREPDVPQRYWNAALALERVKQYDKAYQYATRYAAMETDPTGRERARGFLEHLKMVMRGQPGRR
jgi:tetratricopeptide (TPR) repeat protein